MVPTTMPSLRNALINRDYARLWYGQAMSIVGDYVFDHLYGRRR